MRYTQKPCIVNHEFITRNAAELYILMSVESTGKYLPKSGQCNSTHMAMFVQVQSHCFFFDNTSLLVYVFSGEDQQSEWPYHEESNKLYWFETLI